MDSLCAVDSLPRLSGSNTLPTSLSFAGKTENTQIDVYCFWFRSNCGPSLENTDIRSFRLVYEVSFVLSALAEAAPCRCLPLIAALLLRLHSVEEDRGYCKTLTVVTLGSFCQCSVPTAH